MDGVGKIWTVNMEEIFEHWVGLGLCLCCLMTPGPSKVLGSTLYSADSIRMFRRGVGRKDVQCHV